jgi:hypothetical protein
MFPGAANATIPLGSIRWGGFGENHSAAFRHGASIMHVTAASWQTDPVALQPAADSKIGARVCLANTGRRRSQQRTDEPGRVIRKAKHCAAGMTRGEVEWLGVVKV